MMEERVAAPQQYQQAEEELELLEHGGRGAWSNPAAQYY